MTTKEPTFIRRKFTITETLDQTLQEIATRHYQGNVSLCLRAAIESHHQVLDGEGQFALQQIERQLNGVEQSVQEIRANLDEIPVETAEEEGGVESQPVAWGIQMEGEMKVIIDVLKTALSPLRIEDLLEQTELAPSRLQADLARLVDSGLVIKTINGPERFGLAGQVNCSQGRETGQ